MFGFINIFSFQPLWMMDAKDITAAQHDEFYRFLSGNTYGNPRYVVLYKADAPLNIRAVFYIPEQKPSKLCGFTCGAAVV
jgi:TNF receptor-associated protein 1